MGILGLFGGGGSKPPKKNKRPKTYSPEDRDQIDEDKRQLRILQNEKKDWVQARQGYETREVSYKTDISSLRETVSGLETEILGLQRAASGLESEIESKENIIQKQQENLESIRRFSDFAVQYFQSYNGNYVPPEVTDFSEFYEGENIGIVEPKRQDGTIRRVSLDLRKIMQVRTSATISPIYVSEIKAKPFDGQYSIIVFFGMHPEKEEFSKDYDKTIVIRTHGNYQNHGLEALWRHFRDSTPKHEL